MSLYRYAIGTTENNLVTLRSMGIKPPLQTFKPYTTLDETASGDLVGQGWAQDDWEFGFISDTHRALLRAYCPGASAEVYVKTLDTSIATPAWKIYRAKMRWIAIEEDRQNEHRLKFRLNFKLIEDVTP